MAENNNIANETAQTTSSAVNTVKTAKQAVKAGKTAGKVAGQIAGKVAAAVGWKVIAIVVAVVLFISIFTQAVPSTSFNSLTHVSEDQLIDSAKTEQHAKDLSKVKSAEKEGVNVIAEVFQAKKADVYAELEEICRQKGVDYEATLQYMETNFMEIGEDSFNNIVDGHFSEEAFDAVLILSGYSLSVDNLMEKENGTSVLADKFWAVHMKQKLTSYLSGVNLYNITIDTDENGNEIEYEGVVDKDKSEDLSDYVDEYEDNVGEGAVPDEKDDLRVEYEEFTGSEAFGQHEATSPTESDASEEEASKKDLTNVKFIQATIIKENVENIALEAFDVDETKIQEMYGSTNNTSPQEVIRNMAYNNFAVLHNIDDPETAMISFDGGMVDTSYTIGRKLGNATVLYYCGCNKSECKEARKEQLRLGITGNASGDLPEKSGRVKGVSCASADFPEGTVLYMEDYGLLVVDDTMENKYKASPQNKQNITISVFLGKNHDENVLKAVQQLNGSKHKVNHVPDLLPGNAKAMGRSTGVLGYPLGTLTSRITSAYGYRCHPVTGQPQSFHTGIDLSAGGIYGKPITACDGGKVELAAPAGTYGNCIIIDHGNGVKTRYAHCATLKVSKGAQVSPGQIIATVGSTGRSTGPHLHFEVIKNGETVDPVKYIPHDKITNPNHKNY